MKENPRVRLSLSTLALVFSTALLIAYVPMSVYFDYMNEARTIERARNKRLERTVKLATEFYQRGFFEDVNLVINHAKIANDIQYTALYKNSQLVQTDPPNDPLASDLPLDLRLQYEGALVANDSRTEITKRLDDQTVITLGRNQRLMTSWLEIMRETGGWKFILFVYSLVLISLWSSFRAAFAELRALAKQLTTRSSASK